MLIGFCLYAGLLRWGPIVSSYVPAAALVVAMWHGSREWARWKRQRLVARQSDVAATSLVACRRLADSLAQAASPWSFSRDDSTKVANAARTEHQEKRETARTLGKLWGVRWRRVEPLQADFVAAWQEAEVFLPDDATRVMEELWEVAAGLRASQEVYVMQLRQGSHNEDLFEASVGTSVQKRIAAVQEKAKAALRPIAHSQHR